MLDRTNSSLVTADSMRFTQFRILTRKMDYQGRVLSRIVIRIVFEYKENKVGKRPKNILSMTIDGLEMDKQNIKIIMNG